MNQLHGWRLWAVIAFGLCALLLPIFVNNNYLMQVFFRIVLFAALGLAWNLVGGYAGQLSLGHVAFFGVGAYGLAICASHGVPKWIAFVLAPSFATVFAAIIGKIAFRLRGPYFTLSTIASAEVLRLTATNLTITGGAIGLSAPVLFSIANFWKSFYYSAVVLAIVAFLVNLWTSRSRFGYYLLAIREDEDTASAVGIDTANYKLRSLLLSSFLTALGGALYASAFQYIVPDSALTIEISVQMAIITMLGGAGTLVGPIVGAVLLLSAQELFKSAGVIVQILVWLLPSWLMPPWLQEFLKDKLSESHLLIYGILIVVVVLFLPEGLVGGFERRSRGGKKKLAQAAAAQGGR